MARKCVICGWSQVEHYRSLEVSWHSFQPRAPLWMILLNRLLGGR